MYVLCDTSSIMMLIRIAPDIFIDERYRCCTINLVRGEIFQNSRFKEKYPWRDDYKDKIKGISAQLAEGKIASEYYETITTLERI